MRNPKLAHILVTYYRKQVRKFSLQHLWKSIVWAFQKLFEIPESTFVGRATVRAKLSIFVIFNRNRGNALRTKHTRWQSTRPQMCLSGLELCIRVGKKKFRQSRAPEMTSLNVKIWVKTVLLSHLCRCYLPTWTFTSTDPWPSSDIVLVMTPCGLARVGATRPGAQVVLLRNVSQK